MCESLYPLLYGALHACGNPLHHPIIYNRSGGALSALLFFNVTLISLGSSYVPTEELLENDTESLVETKVIDTTSTAKITEDLSVPALPSANNIPSTGCHRISISSERCEQIGKLLDEWCRNQGYKDSGVKMMKNFPNYSNDVISVECGFSARTQLYCIFKTKMGCTPTAWREGQKK